MLEAELGSKADKNFLPIQPGEMIQTCADITDIERDVGFEPKTDIREGIKKFVSWYREFYKI